MDIRRPTVRKSSFRKYTTGAAFAAFLVVSLIVGLGVTNRSPAIDSDRFWSGTVKRGELLVEVVGAGSLVAPEVRAVTNDSEGVVERVLVLPGRVVQPDDVLVEMSSPELVEELASARLKLEAAEAEAKFNTVDLETSYLDSAAKLADAEGEYLLAKMEVDAQQELANEQVISAIEAERTRVRAQQLSKRLDAEKARHASSEEYRASKKNASRAELSQLRVQVERLQTKVSNLKVKAGVKGVVKEINVTEGERVSAGKAVAKVVNPDNLIARVQVSERDVAGIEIGMEANLNIGTQNMVGKVERVAPTVREQLVEVDIALTGDRPPSLRPDLSVTARIQLEQVDDVLILDRPVSLADRSSETDLFRVSSDRSEAERVHVKVGRSSSRQIEVLAGLQEGDDVILTDLSDFRDEPRIRIR